MPLLDQIKSPADLAGLAPADLPQLAEELRADILEVVGRNGGHLASNLGVVELTIALLRVFNPADDRIIWDVSHQTYAWKLLTGRRAAFRTLRQYQGLSGFQKRYESGCDPFGGGHAGTSLSAAIGMAVARDREKTPHHVIAVIGDASLSNGIAMEALNQIVVSTPRLIVILNDNRMSIGKNVGSLSRKLANMLADPEYNRVKRALEARAHKAGLTRLRSIYYRIEQSIKSLFLGNAFFEGLGIRYVGPVDGHDFDALQKALTVARNSDRPLVLHVVTKKGQGHAAAESHSEDWHAVAPFSPDTPAPSAQPTTGFSQALGHWLERLAETNPRIAAISAAMTSATGLTPFEKKFPQRFFDVGICESHGAVFAAGLAAAGWQPLFAVYSTFFQRAVDSMMHDICLQNLPVVIALDRAGVVGADGPTHHGLYDIAMLRAFPNLTLMQPRDELMLGRMLKTAFELKSPVVIRYPRDAIITAPLPDDCGNAIPPATAEIIEPAEPAGAKKTVWFWALGDRVGLARQTAALLRADGFSAGVVDARFIKPLDLALLREQAQPGVGFITWENAALAGGFGSALREALDEIQPAAHVLRVGWSDTFIPQGTTAQLLACDHQTPQEVAQKARAFF